MPYVQRDGSGAVTGLYANLQPGYAEEWLGEDDAAVIAFRAPAVPHAVTKLQLVRALRAAGKEETFFAALDAAPAETQTDWGLAVEITRDDPLVVAFASGLGLSDPEVDATFSAAAAISGG